MSLSYHDLHIETPDFARTSIFNLPFSVEVRCTRTTGWEVWEHLDGKSRLIAGEFAGPEKYIVLDVDFNLIVDSRKTKWD